MNKKIVKVKEIQDEGLKLIYIEAVLMPNGEIISYGNSLGSFDEFEDSVYELEKIGNIYENPELLKIVK